MTADPVSVSPASSLREAIQQMLAEEVSYVVVVDKVGNPGGFLTEAQVLQTVYQADTEPDDIRIMSVAEPPEVTVGPSMEVREAASQIAAGNVSAALVMDRLDFEGVLTVTDIVDNLGTIVDRAETSEGVGQR